MVHSGAILIDVLDVGTAEKMEIQVAKGYMLMLFGTMFWKLEQCFGSG